MASVIQVSYAFVGKQGETVQGNTNSERVTEETVKGDVNRGETCCRGKEEEKAKGGQRS